MLRTVVGLFVLMLAGCATPNRQYQPVGRAVVLGDGGEGDVAFGKLRAVEFDEQGELWSEGQLASAREMIKGGKIPLLIVFVHGWHHNARPDNASLRSFNNLLKRVAEKANSPRVEVEGVYVGWRGLGMEKGLDFTGVGYALRMGTFFSRKNATELVAGLPLTSALHQLAADAHARGGRVIFVGHSFGGRILDKVMTQYVTGQLLYGSGKLELPADLTLLLNSASESVAAWRLKRALRHWPSSKPAIVSVSSASDDVTAFWWNRGMSLATVANAGDFRDYEEGRERISQRDLVTSTAANSPMLTDRVVEAAEPVPAVVPEKPAAWNLAHASVDGFWAAGRWWRIAEVGSGAEGANKQGYWVMRVPRTIMRSHGDIFNEGAVDLFAALLRICEE